MIHIDDALKHFGINKEEAFPDSDTKVGTPKNGAFFRKELGIDMCMRLLEADGKKDVRKVRIIIDYDADFPVIVHRIKPQ